MRHGDQAVLASSEVRCRGGFNPPQQPVNDVSICRIICKWLLPDAWMVLTRVRYTCILSFAMRLSAQHHGHHHHGVRPCPRRLE